MTLNTISLLLIQVNENDQSTIKEFIFLATYDACANSDIKKRLRKARNRLKMLNNV